MIIKNSSTNLRAHEAARLLSLPHNENGNLSKFLPPGEWETIVNAMIWTEGIRLYNITYII